MWQEIKDLADIEKISKLSFEKPCVIFKHSTSCSISSIAKLRFNSGWKEDEHQVNFFHLDLLRYRKISNRIADQFHVYHESPQLLLIINGESVYDTSHLDISASELREELEYLFRHG